VLLEFFDDDLKPNAVDRGDITEPGHHFEWVWLLNRYQEFSNSKVQPYQKLYDFAHKHGLNSSSGLLWGEVTSLGAPVSSRVRLWPHTEWIKAELARKDDKNLTERVSLAWNALRRFLNCPQPGLWYETYDHNSGEFLPEPSPASSLYHIVLAIDSLNTFVKRRNISL
jgi:mannose/cellobiose epimerase-like protein (N-acyl-D-glucosamine 2-epimerase family)